MVLKSNNFTTLQGTPAKFREILTIHNAEEDEKVFANQTTIDKC